MEAAKEKIKYEYVPATRFYSAAAAEALPRDDEPVVQHRTRVEDQRDAVPRHAKRTGRKVALLLMMALTAAVLLVLMIRYAKIAESYAEVNQLRSDITHCEENLAALEVRLNSAISIDAAREAAERAGMGYPTADQIVHISQDAGD